MMLLDSPFGTAGLKTTFILHHSTNIKAMFNTSQAPL